MVITRKGCKEWWLYKIRLKVKTLQLDTNSYNFQIHFNFAHRAMSAKNSRGNIKSENQPPVMDQHLEQRASHHNPLCQDQRLRENGNFG